VIPSHLDAIYVHEQLIEQERADQAKRWKADVTVTTTRRGQ